MNSEIVTSLITLTKSERKALLALAEHTDIQGWMILCMNRFGWGRATAETVCKKLKAEADAMVL